MKMAVISDTHIPSKAKSLPDTLLKNINGVDLIVHAGDMVDIVVYNQLREIAPVRAVSGNVDRTAIKNNFPAKQNFSCKKYKFGVIHSHQFSKGNLNKLLYQFPESDVIIFGHTHKPYNHYHDGILLFNPGSPTDKRLQPHYSYGIITIDKDINSQIIEF